MSTNESTEQHRQAFKINDDPYRKTLDFVKSPFRYPGGKFYALRYLMPFINCVPHDEFREPFVGGGTIFFAKSKSQHNWINDLEKDIINTYRVIADPKLREEMCRRLENEIANPDRHTEVKNSSSDELIDIAFRTYYLNRTSYSGIINKPAWGYADGKSSPPQNWPKFLRDAGNKLSGVKITNADFEHVITAEAVGETVFMYLDPPYYLADQKRAYTKPFSENDHVRLAALLRQTNFLFCLSYDDCEEIRELYSWAEIFKLNWLYNTANKKGESREVGNELVITNYGISRLEQTSLL